MLNCDMHNDVEKIREASFKKLTDLEEIKTFKCFYPHFKYRSSFLINSDEL
jgi:hypothetical protein